MDMDRYIGRLLDNRYEILEVIGTGGMAVVYKARCHRLNRLVAIKILKDEFTQDEEFRNRFHAESQAVAMLSHPNIVSVYDVSTSDDADYIVMELIDGITLKQYMEKKGVLNWKETLHFAILIAKALDHAHSRGIIHRDIKPHNVMVLKNGSVKVADFGIARVMNKTNSLTREALGSVHYISPEQAKGGRVDNRSDLYSLGVVMYEMMTGRPPYDGESPVAVAIQHINGKAQMPSTLNPNIPGGLEQIIMKAMDQEPAKRYLSAQEMLYDMDEFRKDPAILFDYHNTSTGMDDATLIQSTAQPKEQPPKTTAERTAARAGAAAGARAASGTRNPQNRPVRSRRYQEEIVEDKEKGSKVATVAIAICSVVALIVIIACLVIFFRGGGVDSTKNTVTLPNLLNTHLDEAKKATDYVVEVEQWVYNDTYEKGKIIEQNPKANTVINKGRKVLVIVSNGPQPEEQVMEELKGYNRTTAEYYLYTTLGIDPARVDWQEEPSDTVPAGQVVRTEPSAGTTLKPTDLIRVYISAGPASKEVELPDFAAGNYTAENAQAWLTRMGFKNVTIRQESNTAAKNHVFKQTPAAGTKVEVTDQVILYVSLGGTGSENPTINDKPEPEDYVSKRIIIDLPTDKGKEYTLVLWRSATTDREREKMEERKIYVGTMSAEFYVTGKGVMTFEVFIDGAVYTTIQVDFDAVENADEPEVP